MFRENLVELLFNAVTVSLKTWKEWDESLKKGGNEKGKQN